MRSTTQTKTMNNYILQYWQGIQDGSIIVGQWIRLIYSYIIDGLEKRTFRFSKKKADAAILFIEHFCHHHEGELAPGLIKLELWQKALVSVIFGIVDEDGLRRFREIFIVIGRKNGKSLLASAIAAYCAFLDGEYGARIYFTAPKLDQASICFDAFYQTIMHEPELAAAIQKRRTDIYIPSTNSSARALAFSEKKSDGLNISLAVADEVSAWGGSQGLKFYEVLASATGSRKQPLILSITTAGYVNDGVYDELMKRSTRFLLGGSSETRLLPVIYQIDDPSKWNDLNELQKSNPNLSISLGYSWLLDQIAIAEGSLSKQAEFKAKHCNLKQSSSTAWLRTEDVDKASGEHLDLESFRKCYCVGGIDLSRTTDLTAAFIVIEKDGILNVIGKMFMPAEKLEEATARDGLPYQAYIQRGQLQLSGDNFVDYHDVFQWFRDLVEQYQIYPLKVGYDRYSAQYLVQDMKAYGFHMDDVFQGTNLSSVLRSYEGLLKDGKINIGDNDLLKVHMLGAALKMEQGTERIRLIKLSPTTHIDGLAAVIDAMTVREKYYAEIGGQLKNER